MRLDADQLRAHIEPIFRENFATRHELGAAVSIWHEGKPVLDLYGGFCDIQRKRPWEKRTLALIWSATKGLGTACLLHVLQEHKISIQQRVIEFWPEFGHAGKETITLAQLLSHSAGLAALDQEVDVLEYPAVIKAIEEQRPNWPPGTAHGYHARTFGFLLDELVRRMAGESLPRYWRKTFAEPLKLDIWIGLPEEENSRVANIYPAKAGLSAEPKSPQSGSHFYAEVATSGTFANKVFNSPRGLAAVRAMNKPEVREQPIVSFGGIASAQSLGKFYAMLANGGRMENRCYFSAQTLHWMRAKLVDGFDRVFQIPTAYSAGFMKDPERGARNIFGRSALSFGHPGAGGSHAFADPENNIGFAYVMNQMEQWLLPNDKSLRLVDAVYQGQN